MDDVLEANCPADAGAHVEWDFRLQERQSTRVPGPFQGVKREFGIESLDPGIWANLDAEVISQKATRVQPTAVAKRMLLLCGPGDLRQRVCNLRK